MKGKTSDGIYCDTCGNYVPGHATGAGDICQCEPLAAPAAPERFFLGQDCSGHSYLVPLAKADLWHRWAMLDEDNPKAWKPPKYAKALIGSPCSSNLTFTDPQQ